MNDQLILFGGPSTQTGNQCRAPRVGYQRMSERAVREYQIERTQSAGL